MAKRPISVLILAAGAGTRMKSATPKVLHKVVGRRLIEHVIAAVQALKPARTGVVIGVEREKVKAALIASGLKLDFIVQDQPKGSGHAVIKAKSWLTRKKGTLLVVYGDTPLLTAATLQNLIRAHQSAGHAATFLAMDVANPSGYGRMVVDGQGLLERIVEHRDASPEELNISLVNSGVACWDIASLLHVLPKLKPNNAKHEYYLTDCVALLRARGQQVGVMTVADESETWGVNNRIDLAQAEAVWRKRILEHWMREGVTMADPATTYIDLNSRLAPDVRLGPGVIIEKSILEPGCDIFAYSILEGAVVKTGAKIGPCARLRPGAVIETDAHIGNFVEVKKSRIGRGSKANHLTYIGDSVIGQGVNVGAGTITCNYDGYTKSQTIIEDGVFVGSNTNLVAPVRVKKRAIIGAGSTITKDVEAGSLAVARSPQVLRKGWADAWRKNKSRRKN